MSRSKIITIACFLFSSAVFFLYFYWGNQGTVVNYHYEAGDIQPVIVQLGKNECYQRKVSDPKKFGWGEKTIQFGKPEFHPGKISVSSGQAIRFQATFFNDSGIDGTYPPNAFYLYFYKNGSDSPILLEQIDADERLSEDVWKEQKLSADSKVPSEPGNYRMAFRFTPIGIDKKAFFSTQIEVRPSSTLQKENPPGE